MRKKDEMNEMTVMRPLSARVSMYVLLITALVFGTAFFIFYSSARKQVQIEVEHHAAESLNNLVLHIDEVLYAVEVAVQNNSWQVEECMDTPDSLYGILKRLLEGNPVIIGSAVAFEPDFYPEKGRLFSPYAYRSGDDIVYKQIGTDDYEYHCMDWYQIPKLLDTPYWSEPYFDTGGAEVIMTTYSLPLHDNDGRIFAIFTADLSLQWLTEKVNSLKLYPDSYSFMIGRGGAYLVHPRAERILNETVFTATSDMEDTTATAIGRSMMRGETGFATLNNDDYSTSYVFYAPMSRTGWSVATACTYDDIFSGVDRIRTIVLIISVVGLVFLLVFCFVLIHNQIRPLTRLAVASRNIAHGDLTTPLPPVRKRSDEVGVLYDSFGYMQHSLEEYIKELADTTARKERIESELRIASDIQMGMIPKSFPPFPDRNDIDLYAKLIPAKEVGGDLYDFFVQDECLYFTVGDVSGKGVPASLLMAVTRSLFRNMASRLRSPAAIVSSLNDSLAESNESGMFVTFFMGVLDLKSGMMTYCNAGHNPPVRTEADGASGFLDMTPNLPLGVLEGFPYREQVAELGKGTMLFLYTDGVTEAESPDKIQFSPEKLLAVLSTLATDDTEAVIRDVLQEIHAHASGAEQNDDITMLCLRYQPSN